jgi:hypothetical protein
VQRPCRLEVNAGVAQFRPQGTRTLTEAVALVTVAIAFCREPRVIALLVDTTGLAGVAVPSLVDRFLMAEEWALEGKGMAVVALVARQENIHPQKFGMRVAADFGMVSDIFTSEADALKWLSDHLDQG